MGGSFAHYRPPVQAGGNLRGDRALCEGHANRRVDMRAVLIAMGLFALLAGCNTVEGFGQDVQQGGAAITDTARDTEDEM
jgi:predicted small secreted protein